MPAASQQQREGPQQQQQQQQRQQRQQWVCWMLCCRVSRQSRGPVFHLPWLLLLTLLLMLLLLMQQTKVRKWRLRWMVQARCPGSCQRWGGPLGAAGAVGGELARACWLLGQKPQMLERRHLVVAGAFVAGAAVAALQCLCPCPCLVRRWTIATATDEKQLTLHSHHHHHPCCRLYCQLCCRCVRRARRLLLPLSLHCAPLATPGPHRSVHRCCRCQARVGWMAWLASQGPLPHSQLQLQAQVPLQVPLSRLFRPLQQPLQHWLPRVSKCP